MKHPPYHLRANKAADRLLLIETVARVSRAIGANLEDYTYYGFGGPFLEDFKIVRKFFPDVKLVSIEKNTHTYERQKFHKFCKDIELIHSPFDRFISREYEPGFRDIFWIDFTDMRPSYFGWLEQVLPKLGDGSLLKITLPALPPLRPENLVNLSDDAAAEYRETIVNDFSRKYDGFLANDFDRELAEPARYAHLIVKMVKLAVGRIRLGAGERAQLISAHRYADGIPMVSCAFSVANEVDSRAIIDEMGHWSLAMLGDEPRLLDLPMLSVQERLKLDKLLPQRAPTGVSLGQALGYRIDDNDIKSTEKLRHYAEFQRHFPLFGKLEF